MRAVAYLRVSSLSQVEGHSLDAQESLFYEPCKNRGWEPVQIYREEGKSAHVEAIAHRPVFRKLLDDVTKHEFDVIVVHTLDRWARNLKVMLESLSILAKYNVSLASITENIDYSTPQGKLFTQMLGSFAEYFIGKPFQPCHQRHGPESFRRQACRRHSLRLRVLLDRRKRQNENAAAIRNIRAEFISIHWKARP